MATHNVCFTPKADIVERDRDVRFVPKADINPTKVIGSVEYPTKVWKRTNARHKTLEVAPPVRHSWRCG